MTNFITHPALDLPHIKHGFFTRNGGVSTGIYDSLNCGFGSDDMRDDIVENRTRVSLAMNGALVGVYQSHGSNVVAVTAPFDERPKADGMVTIKNNLSLAVLGADCTPVLFADVQQKIIGACHAGWRGALGGIAENTVRAMKENGAQDVIAVIGPCIRQPSYEVGADFPDAFLEQDQGNQIFFMPTQSGKYLFDLPAYIAARLRLTGVPVHDTGHDTYADKSMFFSHRRDVTHNKQSDTGRLISCITLI